ncbi:DUF4227 family protein [Bacillus piscicola]|uniref:DUF4227 family protein n=1 Tax=Bacillus piscicola TaxID=1632684 RepID=UPI001F09C1E4|nr:DUF4227 family protein [Bacillus piscicola]
MDKWLSFCIETVKVFVMFSVCLIIFYYGIIWLSNSYEGDDRLLNPHTDAEQVQGILEKPLL